MGKMKKEQDGSQQVEFLCMSDRTINVKLCRPIPSSLVINDRQLSKLELRLPVRCIQNQVYDNRIWLMLTDRAAISRSLFLHFFSSCSMSRLARLLVKSTQTLFNQISQKASSLLILFLSLYIFMINGMIMIRMNISIRKFTWKVNEISNIEYCIKYPFVIYLSLQQVENYKSNHQSYEI
jgi:hypothetical protein